MVWIYPGSLHKEFGQLKEEMKRRRKKKKFLYQTAIAESVTVDFLTHEVMQRFSAIS